MISSTIVYNQDANRSRRFTLAKMGASLNFIASYMLYSVFPICGYMDLHLDLFQNFKKQKVVFQSVTTVTNQHWPSWIYLEGMFYSWTQCRHKFTMDSRSAFMPKGIWYVLLWRILRSLKVKSIHFPVVNRKLSIQHISVSLPDQSYEEHLWWNRWINSSGKDSSYSQSLMWMTFS